MGLSTPLLNPFDRWDAIYRAVQLYVITRKYYGVSETPKQKYVAMFHMYFTDQIIISIFSN